MTSSAGPVVTVYAPVSPDTRTAVADRVKASLDGTEAPPELVDAIVDEVAAVARGRTLVLFRSPEREERLELDVELPVIDAQTGKVEARCGSEPWLLPLQMALEDSARYGVVYVDREKYRLFETYLGEIELLAERERLPHEAYETQSPPKQVGLQAVTPARDDAHLDRKQDHEEVVRDRLYRSVIGDLQHVVEARQLDVLLVVGTARNVAAFMDLLPKPLADRAVAGASSLSDTDAPPGRVLEALEGEIEGLEQAREQAVLDELEERGISGLEAVLDAVQQGRASSLVVPWHLAGQVFETDTGWLTTDERAARSYSSEGALRTVALPDAVARLLRGQDFELEVMSGDRADILRNRHQGIAALRRW